MKTLILLLGVVVMANLIWSQSPYVVKTGSGSYLNITGEGLDDGKLKAAEKAREYAITQIQQTINSELWVQIGETDSSIVSQVNVFVGAYVHRLPNRERVNFKLSESGDLTFAEVGFRSDYAFERLTFERHVGTFVKARAEQPDLDKMVDKMKELDDRIVECLEGKGLGREDLELAQKSRHDLYAAFVQNLDSTYTLGLETVAIRNKYVREQADQIATYLDYLFRDPGFRFDFKTPAMRVEIISDEKAYLEVDWEKQLHPYNSLIFDDLNRNLHQLLKNNPGNFDLIKRSLKRVADKHDHISLREVDNYSGQQYERTIDFFYTLDPEICNVSLSLGNRSGKPLGEKSYLSTYLLSGNMFSFNTKYLHEDYQEEGRVRIKIERTLLKKIESILIVQDYRDKISLKETEIDIRSFQARERRRSYHASRPKIDFNLFTATFRPIRTQWFQSHPFRVGFYYGNSDYHSVVRSNTLDSTRTQTTSTGSDVTLDTYTLGAKDSTRGSFTSYSLSLGAVTRRNKNTNVIHAFKATYLGLVPNQLITFRKFDGIAIGSYSLTFESPFFWRHGLSINYGFEAGYFIGPEFAGGGFIG